MRPPAPAALTALVVVSAACIGGPAESSSPPAPQGSAVPSDSDPTEAEDETTGEETADPGPNARARTAEHRAREAALRLRVTGPRIYGPSTGSGVALGPRTVITNRHVVQGGDRVDLVSWHGDSETSSSIDVSYLSDIARVETRTPVPARPLGLSSNDPTAGDEVTVVGFPEGGRVTVEPDVHVVDVVDGSQYLEAAHVLELEATTVEPGSSGGPVLNEDDELAGIVFAIDTRSGHALAIPASVVRVLLDR